MTNPLEPPARLLDLTGTVALVTGAGGNIGAGIARRLGAAGATLAVHHRSRPVEAAGLVAELDGAEAFAGDLRTGSGAADLIEAVMERFGRIDTVVNNAGIQPLAALAEMTDEAWSEMIDVNLTTAHRISQAAARAMEGGGSIIHIASIEGSRPAFDHGHYAVSKAGLIMHARVAALEWGGRGIRVNTVSPGLIARPGIEEAWPEGVARWQSAAPLGRLGSPEDVGDACVFLASRLARWVTGIDLVVDGGVSVHPSW